MNYVYLENGVPLITNKLPKGKQTIGRSSSMEMAQGIVDDYVAEHEAEFEPIVPGFYDDYKCPTCGNCHELCIC